MPTWLAPLAVQGGAVSVLGVLCWRLFRMLIHQAAEHAARAWAVADAADKRADEAVRQNSQLLAGLDRVEALLRSHRDAV
jgi:hypothetical protein